MKKKLGRNPARKYQCGVHGRWILLWLVFVVGAEAASALSYQGSHALVIGVANYTNGWPSLPNVSKETVEVRAALERIGFQVRAVLDPDEKELKGAFEKFIQEYGGEPENRLLFYFSGHGFTSNKQGFLAPADAPELEGEGEELRLSSLPMGKIMMWCREMKAKHALFLFDSCFDDSVFPSVAIPSGDGRIGRRTGRPVRQFIAAGAAGEPLPEKSVFSRMVVRAAQGDADLTRDGSITGTELGRFLRDRVTYYETGQVPQYGKIRDPDLDEGDFVLVLSSRGEAMETARSLYIPIFETIRKGDALYAAGQERSALEKYLAANGALQYLKKLHPNWNRDIVNFRLKYLSERIGPLQVRFPGTLAER